ncbi:MAG: DUF2325 domain-containing protein [Deltaproteobacteria bacterium]|nr:DUF2325 domain-containing protein [Deltaproteobacteria bacterium]
MNRKAHKPAQHIIIQAHGVLNTRSCCCPAAGNCPLEKLKIALIGGMGRLEAQYRSTFEALGAELLFHDGVIAGAGVNRLRAAAGKADVVVFITRINSHCALEVVKGLCKKSGKAFVVMRATGPKQVSRGVIEKLRSGFIG